MCILFITYVHFIIYCVHVRTYIIANKFILAGTYVQLHLVHATIYIRNVAYVASIALRTYVACSVLHGGGVRNKYTATARL